MRYGTAVFFLAGLAVVGQTPADQPEAVPPPSAKAQAESANKIHPTMEREFAFPGDDGRVKAWVLFRRDKGLASVASQTAALRSVQRTYDKHAIERRRLRRSRPGLFDLDDVPVPDGYVTAVRDSGASVHTVSRWVNGVSVRATRGQLLEIAGLPFVEKIQPVRRGRKIAPPVGVDNLGRPGSQSNAVGVFYGESEEQLTQINLIALHDLGFTGAGVRVGVLDTGFERSHVAFNEVGHVLDVIAEYDFVDDDADTSIEVGDPSSQHHHGTWILGTMGAYKPTELVGAAYDASFILCKTEDITGEYQGEAEDKQRHQARAFKNAAYRLKTLHVSHRFLRLAPGQVAAIAVVLEQGHGRVAR